MKQSCLEEKFVSSHYGSPQQSLQRDELGSTPDYPTDGGQLVPQAQTICSPSRSGSRTQVAVPLVSSNGFSDYIHSAVSGSRLHSVCTVLQDIRKTVAKASKRVSDTSCVSFIRDQVTRAARLFIRGLEYVAEGIEMYYEMRYEGFEYFRLQQERIEESLRYMEEMGDRNV